MNTKEAEDGPLNILVYGRPNQCFVPTYIFVIMQKVS